MVAYVLRPFADALKRRYSKFCVSHFGHASDILSFSQSLYIWSYLGMGPWHSRGGPQILIHHGALKAWPGVLPRATVHADDKQLGVRKSKLRQSVIDDIKRRISNCFEARGLCIFSLLFHVTGFPSWSFGRETLVLLQPLSSQMHGAHTSFLQPSEISHRVFTNGLTPPPEPSSIWWMFCGARPTKKYFVSSRFSISPAA